LSSRRAARSDTSDTLRVALTARTNGIRYVGGLAVGDGHDDGEFDGEATD